MQPYESIAWMWNDVCEKNDTLLSSAESNRYARLFFHTGALAAYTVLLNLMKQSADDGGAALALMNFRDEVVAELEDSKQKIHEAVLNSTRSEG